MQSTSIPHLIMQLQTDPSRACIDHLMQPSCVIVQCLGSNYVLLDLRTWIKEDIKTSAAELLYGRPLTIPAEFFETKTCQLICKFSWKNFVNTCESCDQHQRLITLNRACSSSRTSTGAPTSWELMPWNHLFNHLTREPTKSLKDWVISCHQCWG
jgi:hypothetical protein